MVAGIITAAPRTVSSSTSDLGFQRASILDIEWRTPTGYERCAAVITARRPLGLEAITAGHCANNAFSVVRFFDGHALYGSVVRVIRRYESVDAARLFITVDAARVRATPVVVPARRVPPLGTTVSIIGHPVAALRAPDAGRWTITYGRMGETTQNPETGSLEYDVYCSRCGPGDSGSGVFDGEGHLVGLLYGVTEIENVAGGRLPDGRYADVIPAAALR